MRAQPKTCVGRGVGFGIPRQIHVGFDIPQQAKVAVAHRPDARSEFIKKTWLGGRLLHHTDTPTQQIVEHVAEHDVIFEHRVGVTARRRGQR